MAQLKLNRLLLTSTVLVGFGALATPAYAQAVPVEASPEAREQAAQEQTQPGQEVVVTGTLIRNPNLEQASPVTVVGEEEIQLQQANVAEELLRELPGAVPSIGSAVNNGNGGASFVNLRGLGSNRNLVLLNGTRLVPAGLGGQVDLNNIPLALIERVDILTGGAVTTYGADAVAGVVNFITRDDFSGAEINASNQITQRGDGHTFRVDLTVGANFDDGRGNAALSVGYQEADPVYQGERDISRFNIDSFSGARGGSGTTVPTVVNIPGTGNRQLDPASGTFVPTYAPFNFNPFNIFQTPFERFNIFGTARYEVSPAVELYNEGLFSKQTVSTIIAPSGTFGNALTIPISNPFIPAGARLQLCQAAVDADLTTAGRQTPTAAQCATFAGATSVTDPNFRTFTAAISRRFVEAGPRFSDYTTTLFQYKAGVRGDITPNFGYDLFGLYGESENVQRQSGNGLLSRLRNAVFATDTENCRTTAGTVISGCVPLNLFGPQGSITPDQLSYLTGVTTSGTTQTSLAMARGVISGTLGNWFSSTADQVGVAVGAEYRRYTATSVSDLATQTPGEVLGNGAASPDTFGEYDVKEVFGEINIPILADVPGFHRLDISGGARYSDYSTAGGSFTWKVEGSWAPVESFRIRGSYNRATRAPNISELFSPGVTGLDNLANDPCAGSAPLTNAALRAVCLAQGAPVSTIGSIQNPSAGQPNVTTGGNPNLDVERATTWTAGFVFQPDFIPGLAITADYYDIVVTDAITTPAIGDVVAACFANITAASATDPACTGIRRNPLTGGLDGSVATTPGVPLPLSNLGRIETNGVDFTLSYRRDLGFAGFNFVLNGNWTDKSRFQATPSAQNRECVGFYSPNCASIQPEWSLNARTTLSFGAADLSVLYRYIDTVTQEPDDILNGNGPVCGPGNQGGACAGQNFQRIGARHYFDLATRYEVNENMTLTITVQNLFDKDPPLVGSSVGSTAYNSGNTYPSTYDALGRRFAVGARLRF